MSTQTIDDLLAALLEAQAEVERLRELLNLRGLPVHERVRTYLERHPEAWKLPGDKVAKLLGMRRETYSRARAELMRRGLR